MADAAKTFFGRVIAAAAAMLPIMGAVWALGAPYIRAEVRRELEPEYRALVVAAEARTDEKIADIKSWLVRISDKLDRLAEKR